MMKESEAVAALQMAARTAATYLKQCGNEVILPENEDEYTVGCFITFFAAGKASLRRWPVEVGDSGPVFSTGERNGEDPKRGVFAPHSIDFTHARYLCVDGLYYSYLLILLWV